jgi:hypothetical protein
MAEYLTADLPTAVLKQQKVLLSAPCNTFSVEQRLQVFVEIRQVHEIKKSTAPGGFLKGFADY